MRTPPSDILILHGALVALGNLNWLLMSGSCENFTISYDGVCIGRGQILVYNAALVKIIYLDTECRFHWGFMVRL